MKTFEELFEEITPEVRNAKRIFSALQAMFPKLPKFPLMFKNLRGKGSGNFGNFGNIVCNAVKTLFALLTSGVISSKSFSKDFIFLH